MSSVNYRYCERDLYYSQLLHKSQNLTIKQIEQILDSLNVEWVDYTFRFYDDGAVKVTDNATDEEVKLQDLDDATRHFMRQQRIEMLISKPRFAKVV